MTKVLLASFFLILIYSTYGFSESRVEERDSRIALRAYKAGDYTTALKKWRTLSEKGNSEAQYRLCTVYRRAHGVKKNIKKAFEYCIKSSKQGHVLAQVRLGLMYKKGEGIKKNLTLALMWLDVASNKKNSFAIKMRKKIKKKMKPSDIQKSLELSSKWKRKNNKLSCDKL
jgi:TPR repeat protein|tara:strand:+ start:20 stop:532 length:513 start_codon:yes stop_codon:yes gene_type:complete